MTTIDPADNKTFWHVNEYYPTTSSALWATKIGRFAFPIGERFPDFNHDDKPDYVLYNASTRQTAVWYMNNNVFLVGAYYPTLPAGWNVIDVGDFNRDGNLDYALFNASTRQSAIWYLSGVTFIGGALWPHPPQRLGTGCDRRFQRRRQAGLCALQREHAPNGGVVHEQQRLCQRRLRSDSAGWLEPSGCGRFRWRWKS